MRINQNTRISLDDKDRYVLQWNNGYWKVFDKVQWKDVGLWGSVKEFYDSI